MGNGEGCKEISQLLGIAPEKQGAYLNPKPGSQPTALELKSSGVSVQRKETEDH